MQANVSDEEARTVGYDGKLRQLVGANTGYDDYLVQVLLTWEPNAQDFVEVILGKHTVRNTQYFYKSDTNNAHGHKTQVREVIP